MLAQTDMRSLYYRQSGMDSLEPMNRSTLQDQNFSYRFGSEKERKIHRRFLVVCTPAMAFQVSWGPFQIA